MNGRSRLGGRTSSSDWVSWQAVGGREEGTVLLGVGAWLLLVGARSVSVWVVLDEAGRRRGPISANQLLEKSHHDLELLGRYQ